MAYTEPTPADLKERFPEFADSADETIQPSIAAAAIWLDTIQWTETDYFYGIMYLAAHYLSLYQKALAASGGSGGGGGSVGSDTVSTYLSDIKFEDFQVQFRSGSSSAQKSSSSSDAAGSSASSVLGLTLYGLLFAQLRDRNIPKFAVLGAPGGFFLP